MRGRSARSFGKIVNRRLVQQQKKRIQRAVFARRLCTIEIRAPLAAFVQLLNARARYLMQFRDGAKLNRFRWTRFRAGWLRASFFRAIPERAFGAPPVRSVPIKHSKGPAPTQ